jgi:hypothetical protein
MPRPRATYWRVREVEGRPETERGALAFRFLRIGDGQRTYLAE